MIRPGISAPIRMRPIDSLPMAARITAKPLGGTIIAKPPLARIGPIDIGRRYPRRSMSGSRTVPSTAVLATVEPLRLENTVPETTVRMLRRPGRRPSSLSSASIALSATPECHRISPISTNSGIGSSVKLCTDWNMLRASELKARAAALQEQHTENVDQPRRRRPPAYPWPAAACAAENDDEQQPPLHGATLPSRSPFRSPRDSHDSQVPWR